MRDKEAKYIRNCLTKYRKARGLTQQDVAAILGLKCASLISRWESGSCLPSTTNLLRLAAIYRTMVDALYIDLLRSLKADLLERERSVRPYDK